jgi:hypothetical protein
LCRSGSRCVGVMNIATRLRFADRAFHSARTCLQSTTRAARADSTGTTSRTWCTRT